MFGAAVEGVCAFFQRGPQKSTLRCGFVYNCVENTRFTAVFSVFTKYRTDYFLCGGPLKLVTSSDSGEKYLKYGSFGGNVLSVCISEMRI
jgi:hypothetical protein